MILNNRCSRWISKFMGIFLYQFCINPTFINDLFIYLFLYQFFIIFTIKAQWCFKINWMDISYLTVCIFYLPIYKKYFLFYKTLLKILIIPQSHLQYICFTDAWDIYLIRKQSDIQIFLNLINDFYVLLGRKDMSRLIIGEILTYFHNTYGKKQSSLFTKELIN